MVKAKKTIIIRLVDGAAARPAGIAAQPTLGQAPQARNEFVALTVILLLAAAAGCVPALIATLPTTWLAVACASICAVFAALIWRTAQWPLAPVLRVALLASFSFRFEINLLPIFKYHESMPGLNVSLMLIFSTLLAGIHLGKRFMGQPSAPVAPLSFSLTAAALLLWCAVGVLGSAEPTLGFYAVWSLASSLLMCFVVANEFGHRDALRTAVIVIAVAVGLNGLIGLLQVTTGAFTDWTLLGAAKEESVQAIGEGDFKRTTGLLQMANAFGWYLATFLPVLLSVLILRVPEFAGRKRLLLTATTGLGIVALILTYARGSWLAFALSMFVFAVLAQRVLPAAERRVFVKRLAVLGATALLLCLPFAKPIYLRLTEDDKGAAYSRVPLMQVAQAIIADNPLLGVGLSNYEAEMRRYDKTPERISDDFDWPVHNLFMHSAAEAGVPGLLAFLALVVIALRHGWRALKSDDLLLQAIAIGLIVGLLGYLWTGLKEPGSLGTSQLRMCFLFCGLLLAVERAVRSTAFRRNDSASSLSA